MTMLIYTHSPEPAPYSSQGEIPSPHVRRQRTWR
jgi:hypothetical protein